VHVKVLVYVRHPWHTFEIQVCVVVKSITGQTNRDDGWVTQTHPLAELLLDSRDKLIFGSMPETSSDFEDELVDPRMST